jgi:dCTP deaminase
MSIQPDSWIRKMARQRRMIEPFAESLVRKGISHGTGSYGYDMRISNEFRVLRMDAAGVLDPHNFDENLFDRITTEVLDLQPHSLAVGRSVEYFRIPRNTLAIAFGKSTYARAGLVVNVTPFEPEWEGFVTLSLLNATFLPLRVYAHEGIAQVLFLKAERPCQVSYKDRQGKYQAQKDIAFAKVDRAK